MFAYPNQRLSYKDKTKDNSKWARNMIDLLALSHSTDNDEYNRMLSNYRLYNNIVDQKDFEKDCNLLGIQMDQFQEMILPYNKTPNKINVLVADEMKRPFRYMAVLTDASSIKKKENQKTKMLQEWFEVHVKEIEQEFKMKQAKEGASEEEQQQLELENKAIQKQKDSLVPPEKLDGWFKTKYRDSREIASNKLLNYLYANLRVKEKKEDGFKHGLISGKEVIWVGVEGDSLAIKNMNSLNTFHHKSVDTKYIQDGLYAGSRVYASIADTLALYGEDMTEEEIKSLDSRWGFSTSYNTSSDNMQTMQYDFSQTELAYYKEMQVSPTMYGQYDKRRTNEVMIVHVEWISQRKIGFLTFTNEYGDEELKLVDESFILPSDAKKTIVTKRGKKKAVYSFSLIEMLNEEQTVKQYEYEEDWIPQVWEGIRVGSNIYPYIGPKRYPYFSVQNPKKHKLGYHGVIYSNTNAPAISIMDRMKPFQHLYFVIMHKLRKLIAQDKGKVFHLNEMMIPESLGIEKTMYYLTELNLDIYNPLQSKELPGGFNDNKVTGSTDWSQMQHIMNYIQLLDYIDNQISEAAGVNKGREGQSFASQAVTTAQQDLLQSSLVTEIYYAIHNSMWEDVLNYLLSVARKYYKDNRISHLQYVLDDLSLETLSLTEDDLEDSDLGVFVSDSMRENRVFETLNQISQSLIQNDKANMSHIISILESQSLAELKREMKTFEEQQSQQAQAERDAQMEMQKQAQEYARETMIMKENIITERELAKAEIDVFKFQKDLDSNNDGIPDPLEIEKLKMQRDFNDKELAFKEKELTAKKEIEQQKVEAAKIKAAQKPRSK